jgi:hypothetical protein
MASIRGLRRAKRIGHVPRDVGIRIISTLGFSRVWWVCGAFVAHLSRPFGATDVRGWPFSQGGAPRLRLVALPWASLFCPSGRSEKGTRIEYVPSRTARRQTSERRGVTRPAREAARCSRRTDVLTPTCLAPGPHVFAPLPGGLRRSAKKIAGRLRRHHWCLAPSGNAVKHLLGGDGLSFQFSQFVCFIPT